MFSPLVCLSPRARYGLIRFATLSLMGICAVHSLSPPQTLCWFTLGTPTGKGYKKDRHTGDETINELYYGLKNGL